MQKLNNRILKHKEEILSEIAKGYKPSAVAKVFELDTRTIKKALDIWKREEAVKALEAAKAALETSKQK
ncbi:MAG: hypothetical protein AB7D34_01340 [Sulfurimonas sp.]